ncbi:TPA: hypothetical protein KBR23_002462 [Listeria monocytogenes]|nr:hypothetical protein [Listeria monocytogenes]
MENLEQLQERVAVSDGRAKADLVIKNGRIINVAAEYPTVPDRRDDFC